MEVVKWHKSGKINEDGRELFKKQYDSDSFEFANEISWFCSPLIRSCRQFELPRINDIDYKNGLLKMDYIDGCNKDISIEKIIDIASEIHCLLKSDHAVIRGDKFSKKSYLSYVKKYFEIRVNKVKENGVSIDDNLIGFIYSRIDQMKIPFFTITHRDLYKRNMINTESGKTYLIDWEFANISEPSQDVAKII